MRHLIDPMDLSVQEIEKLLALANDIIEHKENIVRYVRARSLQPYF